MQMLVNYSWIQNSKQQLLDIVKHNSQALLLYGNQGIGKKSLSLWLAKILLCDDSRNINHKNNNSCNNCSSCHLFDIFQHPDLHILDSQDESSNTSSIGIESIHSLITKLQQTPHMSKMQVVIIYTIEKLTLAAANSLLKTLEEPNNSTIFILVSHNIKQVLPTILSRCISLSIPYPNKNQGIEWMKQNNHNLPISIINLFAHKPLLVRNYDEALYNNTIQFLLNPYDTELKIDSKKTQQLSQILTICSYWLFDLLYYIHSEKFKYFTEIPTLKGYIKNISINDIHLCWQELTELCKPSHLNLNTKLILGIFTYKYQDIFKSAKKF